MVIGSYETFKYYVFLLEDILDPLNPERLGSKYLENYKHITHRESMDAKLKNRPKGLERIDINKKSLKISLSYTS